MIERFPIADYGEFYMLIVLIVVNIFLQLRDIVKNKNKREYITLIFDMILIKSLPFLLVIVAIMIDIIYLELYTMTTLVLIFYIGLEFTEMITFMKRFVEIPDELVNFFRKNKDDNKLK